MTFPGFCPSGTRFGWTSFECIPTAFSLPSLLEEKLSPETAQGSGPTSSMTSVLTVGGLLLGMAAAVAIGVAAANAEDRKAKRP